MKKGIIYKITNNTNGKMYIGQSSLSIQEKKIQYQSIVKRTIENNLYPRLIIKAFIDEGFDNFTFEVLEEDVDEDKLNELEEYYIWKYKSFFYGYNKQIKSRRKKTNERIKKDIKLDIRRLLLENKDLEYIMNKYPDITKPMIQAINDGKQVHHNRIIYPINENLAYKKQRTFKHLSSEEVKAVQNILATDEKKTVYEIGKEYGVSGTAINKINKGEAYFNPELKYPIRNFNVQHPNSIPSEELISDYDLSIVINCLLNGVIYKDILSIVDSNRFIITNINRGKGFKRRIKKLFPDVVYPIRKNILSKKESEDFVLNYYKV